MGSGVNGDPGLRVPSPVTEAHTHGSGHASSLDSVASRVQETALRSADVTFINVKVSVWYDLKKVKVSI